MALTPSITSTLDYDSVTGQTGGINRNGSRAGDVDGSSDSDPSTALLTASHSDDSDLNEADSNYAQAAVSSYLQLQMLHDTTAQSSLEIAPEFPCDIHGSPAIESNSPNTLRLLSAAFSLKPLGRDDDDSDSSAISSSEEDSNEQVVQESHLRQSEASGFNDRKETLTQCLHQMQELLEEPYSKFAQPAELDNLRDKIQDSIDWLFTDETATAAESAFEVRNDNLHGLVDPIMRRYQESTKRPSGIQDLLRLLILYPIQIMDERKFSHIDVLARRNLVEICSHASEWLDTQLIAQARQPMYSDPILKIADLETKRDEIISVFLDLGIDHSKYRILDRDGRDLHSPGAVPTMADIASLSGSGIKFIQSFSRNGDVASLEKAVYLLHDAATSMPIDHPSRAGLLSDAASAFRTRFQRLGNITDIDAAISLHSDAVRLTPDDSRDKPRTLNNLGNSLLTKFQWSSSIADIDAAISKLTDAVMQTPDGHLGKPARLSNLGASFDARFQRLGNVTDVDSAILMHTEAVELTPKLHPDKPGRLNNLAVAFDTRFSQLGNLHDLENAILMQTDAVQLTPDDHPEKPRRLSNLGIMFTTKFQQLGDVASLDSAISVLSDAIDLSPDGHPDKSRWLSNLANSFLARFHRLANISDLDASILMQSDAVTLTRDGNAQRPHRLSGLGSALQTRFQAAGSIADIESAVSAHSSALALTPDNHPDKLGRLSNLGISLRARFERLGNIADLDSAISMQSNALKDIRYGHPHKHLILSNLGNSFSSRFQRLGDIPDMDAAVSLLSDAVALTPNDHPEKPRRLSNLAIALRSRFERQGRIADLQLAISMHTDAVSLTQDGHPDKPIRLNNLGSSLWTRFHQLGDITDIDSAIFMHSSAVTLCVENHPERPRWLSNLGISYRGRFDRLHDLPDLHAAIDALRNAVTLTPNDHAEKPRRLSNLGVSLRTRYERLESISDLTSAISAQSDAVALLPDDHPEKPRMLSNLGVSFLVRSQVPSAGNGADIDSAISVHSNALSLTPDGHPHKPFRLTNLGNSFQAKFQRWTNMADLNCAVVMYSDAATLTPGGYIDKVKMFRDLGNSLFTKFMHTSNVQYLEDAISTCSRGAEQPVGSPSALFDCSMEWMRLARIPAKGGNHHSLIRACTRTLELVSRIVWIGFDVERRLEALRDLPRVATDAAAFAIESGKYELALEWLEQGRSILWGQLLQLRTPYDHLRERYPALAEDMVTVSKALEGGNIHQALNREDHVESLEEASKKHRQLAEKWDHLLQQVRSLPGFERFLLPKSFSQLAPASAVGPVVVLTASRFRCDVLVLKSPSEGISHIPLSSLTSDQVYEMHQYFARLRPGRGQESDEARHVKKATKAVKSDADVGFASVLNKLWFLVVRPVLSNLDLQKSENPPRIWWCPVGPFASLPIHAAGAYDGDSSTATSDFVISSYTVTLDALIPRPVDGQASFKLLAISQENAPDASPLPATVHEVACIRKLASPEVFLGLEGSAATVDEVLSNLKLSRWLHLACHGKQDTSSPLDSAFLLYDKHLKLSMIMQESLPNAEFAFLSACQTAMGDAGLPDEATHLAAGLLFAGFHSVIATLWSIADADGPTVVETVYRHLFRDERKPDGKQAAYALHMAIHKLRRQRVPLDRWVPFIHIGL